MAGLIADDEDTQHTGAPEFSVAVRTQLLVGEASYAIQDQPAYATAFTQMEHMEEDVCVQVGAETCIECVELDGPWTPGGCGLV